MKEITAINDRTLIYQRHALGVDWAKAMLLKNWLLLVVIEGKNNQVLQDISSKVIDNDACYICCVGEQGELLHDWIDEEIVFREVYIQDHYLPPFDVIMTTWHSDLNEALWFAFFAAHNSPEIIETILLLDASELGVESSLDGIIKSWD